MFISSIIQKFILGYILLFPLLPALTSERINLAVNLIFLCLGTVYVFILRENIKKSLLNPIIILFFSILIFSAFFSHGIAAGLEQAYRWLPFLILFYIVKVSNEDKKKWLLRILLLSACLVSLYSLRAFFIISGYISSYLQQHNINYYFAQEFLARKRAFAPFITPNLLAGYLTMVIFIAVGIFLKNKHKTDRLIALSCLTLSLPVFFLTKSIGGWLSMLSALCFFLFFNKKINPVRDSSFLNKYKISNGVNKKVTVSILMAILILTIIFIARVKEAREITAPLFSLQQRISYWAQTIEIIKQHPLIGVGAGNLSLKGSLSSHNSYLQIWAETGIAGLIGWLAIVFIFIKRSVGVLQYSKRKAFWAGTFCAGLSFLFHNLIDFSFFIPQAAFLWWIVLALATASPTPASSDNH
ncbi:MAG: O-antigen ligase family protein [Candidatus Omnitrophota bacterium]